MSIPMHEIEKKINDIAMSGSSIEWLVSDLEKHMEGKNIDGRIRLQIASVDHKAYLLVEQLHDIRKALGLAETPHEQEKMQAKAMGMDEESVQHRREQMRQGKSV